MPTLHRQELLERAATGSLEHLNALSWAIHDHKDYDPKICSDLVHLLDPALIPARGTARELAHDADMRTKVAEKVLAIFLGVCEGLCKKQDSVRKSALAHLLAQHRHSIFRWMRFFIDKGTLIELVSCLILVIWVLDRGLQEAILTSTTGVDTILAAWTQRGVDGRYEVVTQPPLCALLILFRDLVAHPGGADVLSELLIPSAPRLKRLIRTLIIRVSDIGDRCMRGQVTTPFALEYIHDLLDVVRKLLHQQHIWIPLFSSGKLLATLPSTLLIIGGPHKGVRVWRDVARCLRHLVTFCLTGGMGSINPVHQVGTALSGGVLQVIYGCLTNLPPSDPDFSFVLLLLGDFAAYAVYTRVVEPFASAFQRMMAMPKIPRLSRLSGEFLGLTSTITTNISVVKSMSDPKVKGGKFCDSNSHCRQTPERIMKECSGCHSAFYCSDECQKADWSEYHRDECLPESRLNNHRRKGGVSLSASLRLRLLEYIESYCKFTMPAFDALRVQKHGATPLHSLVIFIDHVSMPPALDVTTLDTYKRTDGLAHYRRRVGGYMEQFVQRREVHLVEVLFPYGGCTIRVFARLWKEDDNTFHALSAIFGLIESKETDRDGKTARQIRDYQAGELGCQ